MAEKTPSFAMSISANGGGGGARPFCTFPPAQRATRTVTLAAAPKPDVAAETKPRQPRGIMKPRLVSPEMREFLGGVSEIERTKALKEIWAYIKLHDLQDFNQDGMLSFDEFSTLIDAFGNQLAADKVFPQDFDAYPMPIIEGLIDSFCRHVLEKVAPECRLQNVTKKKERGSQSPSS